jgi:hypothetical protein
MRKKLSPEQILEIEQWDRRREELGTLKSLAHKYDVSRTLVEQVIYDARIRQEETARGWKPTSAPRGRGQVHPSS